MERTGHRSEKDRAPEWNKRDDRGKAQGERRKKNMNIAYGIKGKTAEKEAYGRRKIWSREKKEQERGL